ncbi:hypothetical protein DUNSADRAFT_18708 [Dunaliella salina]|uniref:Encoded protein n=1 Tax=Dunaliella salina TaxID=3046 RepID=A0ABQ7FZM7_DUNSA|nr:hypothetical protein DUNSADRAFT_18708 [Dunaliella salina]|eukprot:KAF5827803.1 hypothetical protein DUNSADRAFT_18708 [Dunaliella salina]
MQITVRSGMALRLRLLSPQIIIRSGMTEAEIDAEVVAMLEDTEAARESDEGVNSVLLAAAQDQMVRSANAQH